MATPRSSWTQVQALVYSVEYFEPSRNDFGHYTVVYSYEVGEERYTGKFYDYTDEQDYLHQDDTIDVRYDPGKPDRSFYPDARSATKKRLAFAIAGLVIAAIVMTIAYLTGGFAHHRR